MTDESPLEALGRIEERLSRASEAAERLIAQAGRARRPKQPPPAGWQAPPREEDRHRRGPELELLATGARLFGEIIPPEALEHLAAALRELLLAVRAVIDHYVERLGQRTPQDRRVQDIPIE
jgi:hypothetical protein